MTEDEIVASLKREAVRRSVCEQRAHALGLCLVTLRPDERDPVEPPYDGPYGLACAETGYQAHVWGVGFDGIEAQLAEIEVEPAA